MISCSRAENVVIIRWPENYVFAVRSVVGLSFKRCLKDTLFLDDKEFPKSFAMDENMPEVKVRKNGYYVTLSFQHNGKTIVCKTTMNGVRHMLMEISNACEDTRTWNIPEVA